MITEAFSFLSSAASAPDTGSATSGATGAPIAWNQRGEWNSATGSASLSAGLPSWVFVAVAAVAALYLLKKG